MHPRHCGGASYSYLNSLKKEDWIAVVPYDMGHTSSTTFENQYNLAYHPSNAKLDGSYRKLKVKLVAPDGGPLKVRDQKGTDVKVTIAARDGYTAKQVVE